MYTLACLQVDSKRESCAFLRLPSKLTEMHSRMHPWTDIRRAHQCMTLDARDALGAGHVTLTRADRCSRSHLPLLSPPGPAWPRCSSRTLRSRWRNAPAAPLSHTRAVCRPNSGKGVRPSCLRPFLRGRSTGLQKRATSHHEECCSRHGDLLFYEVFAQSSIAKQIDNVARRWPWQVAALLALGRRLPRRG